MSSFKSAVVLIAATTALAAMTVMTAAVGHDAMAVPLVVGPHYAVDEPDMLTWIERRLAAKQASGELAARIDAATASARRLLEQPPALEHITRAATRRTGFYDPSYTADRNIYDHEGGVLVAAGTRVNPLAQVGLRRPLIFFDARDPDQAAFARRYLDSQDGRARPILTGGSYVDLMRRWQVPVYYDQRGLLVRRLGIRHVPAIVAQDGLRLRIDEIAL